jgi:hypothetical protein
MSQYQLVYDSSGDASLKEIAVVSTQKISEGTFNVSEYFAPRMDYGIIETYKDKNSYEEQLILIQNKFHQKGEDKDDKDPDYKKDLSPEFNWKTYMYNTLVNALGKEAADDYMKYAKIEDFAKVANWASLVFPVNWIAKLALKGAGKYAETKKQEITGEYLNSSYYNNKMKAMDLEYKDSGDYDVYSDINWGPSYGKEYKPGTIYDAEDHGEPPDGLMTQPKTVTPKHGPVPYHDDRNQDRNGPTGHGDAGKAGGEATETIGSF